MKDMLEDKGRLLIVDDDPIFNRTLQRAMERRGFATYGAATVADAKQILEAVDLDYAIIDLRIGGDNGLDLLEYATRTHPTVRSIILTGYGDVATAVSATKLSAFDYMAKPADAEAIEAALRGLNRPLRKDQTFPRPEVQEFRYLLAMYEQHGRNMSETARAAGMHRRTLQRILRRHGIGPSEQIPMEERSKPPHVRRLYRLWANLLNSSSTAPIDTRADTF